MDKNILFKISYGLYIISARYNNKDNGCIINTVIQITENPLRLAASVNKSSYTSEMIFKTDEFNISILSENSPFYIFDKFGFQSGKNINKFENIEFKRSSNNIAYTSEYTCAFIMCSNKDVIDLGSHYLFIADIKGGNVLSNDIPLTYSYYKENIKPPHKEKKNGLWKCDVCGYIYEGEEIPEDFVCPWCKHGATSFIKI